MSEIKKRVSREKTYHNEKYQEGTRSIRYSKFYKSNFEFINSYNLKCLSKAKGGAVLEYGGGTGTALGKKIIDITREFNSIDISAVAIEKAKKFYGVGPGIFLKQMDAHETEFADASFDLIYATAIIHHLDIPTAIKEIRRLLKVDGQVIMLEPLGTNPLINIYRRVTPSDRSPDEQPLLPRDIALIKKEFRQVHITYHNIILFAATAVGLEPDTKFYHVLKKLDSFLCSIPIVRRLAWYSLIIAKK